MRSDQQKSSSKTALILAALTLISTILIAVFAGGSSLTGTLGPESAQILTAFSAPLLFLHAATYAGGNRKEGFIEDLYRQLFLLVLVLIIFVGITTFTSFTLDSCAPNRGYLAYIVLAFPTMLLSSALGLLLGRFVKMPKVALFLASVILSAFAVWTAIGVYQHPSFRLLTHFWIALEGDLFAGSSFSQSLGLFRLSTFCFAILSILLGILLFPGNNEQHFNRRKTNTLSITLINIFLLIFGLSLHFKSQNTILGAEQRLEETYSFKLAQGNIEIRVNPNHHTLLETQTLLAEADLWLKRLEKRLEHKVKEKIVIYLHKDQKTLAQYTGAEHVHIAMPWLRKLHISTAKSPHFSLGHEIAHVVLADFNDSIFKVPSHLLVIADSAMIEGFAMALTSELNANNGLTLFEQAAALEQLELAPNLEELFIDNTLSSFWSHAPKRAYTVAGALILNIYKEKGIENLKKAYHEGSLSTAFSDEDTLRSYIKQYVEDLKEFPLTQDALDTSKRLYQRPSILKQSCKPEQKKHDFELTGIAQTIGFKEAEESILQGSETLSLKNHLNLINVSLEKGDSIRAIAYINEALSQDSLSAQKRAFLQMKKADITTYLGHYRQADALYDKIKVETLSPSSKRALLTRKYLCHAVYRSAKKDILAIHALNFLTQNPKSGNHLSRILQLNEAFTHHKSVKASKLEQQSLDLSQYLIARQYFNTGAIDKSLELLINLSLRKHNLPEELRLEILRLIAVGHAKRGDLKLAITAFKSLKTQYSRAAPKEECSESIDRLQYMLQHQDAGSAHLFGLPTTDLK